MDRRIKLVSPEMKALNELAELSQDCEVETAVNRDFGAPACVFSNRISDAAERLSHQLAAAGIDKSSFAEMPDYVRGIGRLVSDLKNQTVEAVSIDCAGGKITLAATPVGLNYAADITTRSMMSRVDADLAQLSPDQREDAQKALFRSLFPDAKDSMGSVVAGRFGDIRLKSDWKNKTAMLSAGSHLAVRSLSVVENVTINSLIGFSNLIESMTTPAGANGPVPISYYSSSIYKDFKSMRTTHSIQDILAAATKSEILLRGCLVHKNGVAQDMINPARADFMEMLLLKQNDLKALHTNHHKALRQAAFKDQSRVRKEHEEKMAAFQRDLFDKAGLETGDDTAFARKLVTAIKDDQLIASMLSDSVIGKPIVTRLHSDFIKTAIAS